MKRAAALALTAAILGGTPALAQLSPGGGPIDITANELQLVDAQHEAVWRGDVEALQGRNRMRAQTINIFFAGQGQASGAGAPGKSWGPVKRIEADGQVFFISPDQTARGDHAVYELASDTITMTGDVIVVQGESVVHGDKLVIQTKTGHATMVSNSQGRNRPNRVRGVFYPNGPNSPAGASRPRN